MSEPTVVAVMRCSDCGQIVGSKTHLCARAPLDSETAVCGQCGARGGSETFPVRRGRLKSPCRECQRKYRRGKRKDKSDPARTNRWRAKHRHKNNAQQKLRHAVKTGKLERQPCEKCGNPKSEAHHADYSKPLDVKWLCRQCHAKEHRVYV